MSPTSEKTLIGDKNIVLVGFMGTGKSTVGRILSKKTGRPFFDTDGLVEEGTGKTIGEIFAQDGEGAFRELESRVIRELESVSRAVISTGGGALLQDENLRSLKAKGFLIWLESTPEAIHRRLARARNRPLLPSVPGERLARIKRLLKEREARYALADLSIRVCGKPSQRVAREILSKVEVA